MPTLFKLLQLLEVRKVSFTLARTRPDTIQVDAVLVGERLELDVFEDGHIEFSRFRGNEDVEGEWPELMMVLDSDR